MVGRRQGVITLLYPSAYLPIAGSLSGLTGEQRCKAHLSAGRQQPVHSTRAEQMVTCSGLADHVDGITRNLNLTQSMRAPAEITHFEFGGLYLGPLAIIVGLPAVCYGLTYICNAIACFTFRDPLSIPGFPPGTRVFSWQAVGLVVGWTLFMASSASARVHV